MPAEYYHHYHHTSERNIRSPQYSQPIGSMKISLTVEYRETAYPRKRSGQVAMHPSYCSHILARTNSSAFRPAGVRLCVCVLGSLRQNVMHFSLTQAIQAELALVSLHYFSSEELVASSIMFSAVSIFTRE